MIRWWSHYSAPRTLFASISLFSQMVKNMTTHYLLSTMSTSATTYIITVLMPHSIEWLIVFFLLFTIIFKRRQIIWCRVDQSIARPLSFWKTLPTQNRVQSVAEIFMIISVKSFLLLHGLIKVIAQQRVAVGVHVPTLSLRSRFVSHRSRRKRPAQSIAVLDLGKIFRIV